MAYIGAVAPGYDPTRASVPQLDAERFSGDATTTAFTLTRQVVSPTDIDVIVENVTQEPTVAYSVNGYTLTFTGAPGVGTNNIYVIYRGSGISNYAFVPDGSITYAKLANNIKQFTVDAVTANGTGSTVALTEAPASANSIIVSVDGVIQTAPTNYTLSGSTITFTGVPDNGANVVVRHIGFRTTSTVTALQASSVTATEIADGSITNVKIVSVANTKISGNIVSSQITSVANTQISGNIISSQIASVNGSVITANTIANSAIQTGAVENYMNAAGLGFGMRNRIINGAMAINQRGWSGNITTGNEYTLDRFIGVVSVSNKFSVSQSTSIYPSGFNFSLLATSQSAYTVGAAEQFILKHSIEAYNTNDLAWGTASASAVTLSFRVYSSLTGTFGGAVFNSNGSRSYPFTYSIPTANTWTTISITIAGDTSGTWAGTNGVGISVSWGLGVGSTYSGTAGAWAGTYYASATGATSVVGTNGATFYITGVQLEKGSTATSFDYRPYGTEFMLCQRYAQIFKGSDGQGSGYVRIGQGNAQSTSSGNALVTPPVRFRANPTVTTSGSLCVYDGAAVTATSGGATIDTATAPNSVMLSWSGASGLTLARTYQYLFNNDTAAYLLLSAEL